MIVVRHDCIGKAELKLIKRPTNTCAWIDNFHVYADAPNGTFPASVVRFLGTDPVKAEFIYNMAFLEVFKNSV